MRSVWLSFQHEIDRLSFLQLNNLIKTVTDGLRTSIQSDITSANSVINGAIDAINKVNPFSDIKAPQIPVPNLDGLQNIALPPSFQQALTNLNSSLPTVADLKDKIESMYVLSEPFYISDTELYSVLVLTHPLNF